MTARTPSENRKLRRLHAWCRLLTGLAAAATLSASAQSVPSSQPWRIETIAAQEGSGSGLPLAVRAPERVKHVVIVSAQGGEAASSAASGSTRPEAATPWVRAAALLSERGIAVVHAQSLRVEGATAGAPSALREDLQAAVTHLQQRFAGAPLHLGLFSTNAAPALEAAARIRGLSRIVVVSGGFLDARASDWRAIGAPVLLIHAPTSTCEHAPFLEAQAVARSNRFALTVAGYPAHAHGLECGPDSHHALAALDTAFADTVAAWLEGTPAPSGIGFAPAPVAWSEEIVTYAVPGTFGPTRLEMTLLFPPGKGPHPIVVFNHGDFGIDSPHLRYKRRYREPVVASEFLRLGFAVALPARRGVGMSEGSYPSRFYINDGDPTYKARVHAQDIVPAIDHLRSLPAIDARRIVLAGHSAGGFSAAYIAGTNPPGVIAAVDFSGGRTDATQTTTAGPWNRTMIRGFEEIGRTSRVPTLFLFAENDPLYAAETIRGAYAAFVQAGGKGRLLLTPPVPGDGHLLLREPGRWRDTLDAFLAEVAGAAQRSSAGR